jgi:creatinine amidohydrolase
MTWKEIDAILPHVRVAVIPTGSTEQHGPHLPLQSDTVLCLYICRKASEIVYPIAMVTPPISVGISTHHLKFAGTLTLRPETFINIMYDFAWSMKRHGINKIAIINGHGGNDAAVKIAARKIYDELGIFSASLSYWELLDKEKAKEILNSPSKIPGHASEFETSLSYVVQPQLIRIHLIGPSEEIHQHEYESFFPKLERSKSGVSQGDPRIATLEKGKRLIEIIIAEIATFLIEFAKL